MMLITVRNLKTPKTSARNPKTPKTSADNKSSSGEGDRFSNLPEPLILYIFSFLETIDIIRASAVSRKWRYLWISMPYLNFNIGRVWSRPLEKWDYQTMNEKFKELVYWVLSSQDRSVDIQRFRLSCLHDENDLTLHRLITILAQRNVKELDLEVSKRGADFPRTLLSCESLVTLKLEGRHSVLKLPSVVGFMRLKSLDLNLIELKDSKLFQNFISSCPLLEDLTMVACIFRDFSILDISTTSLKKLAINNYGHCPVEPGDGLSTCELKIVCPSLAAFSYIGPLGKDFSFQHRNSLEEVLISIEDCPRPVDKECQRRMFRILQAVRNTKSLKLCDLSLDFLYPSLGKPMVSFRNLKCLKITVVLEENLQSIINLLNCSPNLEALAIHWDWIGEDGFGGEIPDEAIECLTCHLKMVELFEFGGYGELSEFEGYGNELEFIRFLLQEGHVLQKVKIHVSNVENLKEIILDVMKFPISSEEVAFSFVRLESLGDFDNYAGSG